MYKRQLLLHLGSQRLHDQRLLLGGADLDAVAAAGAVQGADLHAVLHAGELLAGGGLGLVAFGRALHHFFGRIDGTDAGMRAHPVSYTHLVFPHMKSLPPGHTAPIMP